MLSLCAEMDVRLNDAALGRRMVSLERGRLWWDDGGPEPFCLWLAARVAGEAGRVLVVYEGATVIVLHPTGDGDGSVFREWLEAVSAWTPASGATRRLLRQLARVEQDEPYTSAATPQRTARVRRQDEALSREMEALLKETADSAARMDLMAAELAQTKAELSTNLFLLKEADAERAVMRKQLESVNSVVRLKAIGLLMQKNPDLANLKLQVDCYQEQLEFLAGENERIKADAAARLRASDELVEGLIARLREVRAETARLRRVLFAPSAEEKGLSAEALLEQLERLKRSLFFAVGAQLRQAHTFLNSATSGLPLPDLTRLYEEYSELPEGQWREKLAAAFGVADSSIV